MNNTMRVFTILAEIELLRRQIQETDDAAQRVLLAGQIAGKLEELQKLQTEAGTPSTDDIMATLQRFAVESRPDRK